MIKVYEKLNALTRIISSTRIVSVSLQFYLKSARPTIFLNNVKEGYLRTSAKLWYRLGELESSDVVELKHLQHLLGFWIDLDDVVLQSGDLRNIVVSAFPLFFLQLDGDTTYLTVPKPLHQVSDKSNDYNTIVIIILKFT